MRYVFLITIILTSHSYGEEFKVPDEVGIWEFNEEFTLQSIYDLEDGLIPIFPLKGDKGVSFVPPRIEFHFERKYYDFGKKEVVEIGYFDNGEFQTKKIVPFKIHKNTYQYVSISYATYYGEKVRYKIRKTPGCYYIDDPKGWKEYYCKVQK